MADENVSVAQETAPVETAPVVETSTPQETQSVETTPTVAPTIRERYDAIVKKANDDPNVRLSAAELDLISDIKNGKEKLEELPVVDPNAPEPELDADGNPIIPLTEEQQMTALDTEITDVMDKMGVEKFEELPKKIKEVFTNYSNQIQQKDQTIAQFTQEQEQIKPIFQNMENLMIRLYNGDQTAKAEFQNIMKQRGIDPSKLPGTQSTGIASEINPDDFLDPELYKLVNGKIVKLENSVNEFITAKQQEVAKQQEQMAQSEARNQVSNEFTDLVTKYPVFGLKAGQVKEGLDSYFKTGIVPKSMAPLFELVAFTDKFNKDNGYSLKLEHAYKLRLSDSEGQRTADAIKKAKMSLIKQKPTVGVAGVKSQNQISNGSTTYEKATLEKMARTSDYPDSWKSGMALDVNKIPAGDLAVLQLIWNASKRPGVR